MNLGVLDEFPVLYLFPHVLHRAKIVMHPVHLPLAGFARRVTHAESEFTIGKLLLQEFDKRSLPWPSGGGKICMVQGRRVADVVVRRIIIVSNAETQQLNCRPRWRLQRGFVT